MAITFFGDASTPTDNASQDDSVARSVTPPGSMLNGDFVYVLVMQRNSTATVSVSNTGGQSWTTNTQSAFGGSAVARTFWCRFNGTWSANPSFTTDTAGTLGYSVIMLVFRPTNGANTWSSDVALATNSFTGPGSPFDVTATGQTSISTNTVTIAAFFVIDDDSWILQTAGWANPSQAQYRNLQGSDMSASFAYKIQTSPAATGNVTNRQSVVTGTNGRWFIQTFAETQAPIPPWRLMMMGVG